MSSLKPNQRRTSNHFHDELHVASLLTQSCAMLKMKAGIILSLKDLKIFLSHQSRCSRSFKFASHMLLFEVLSGCVLEGDFKTRPIHCDFEVTMKTMFINALIIICPLADPQGDRFSASGYLADSISLATVCSSRFRIRTLILKISTYYVVRCFKVVARLARFLDEGVRNSSVSSLSVLVALLRNIANNFQSDDPTSEHTTEYDIDCLVTCLFTGKCLNVDSRRDFMKGLCDAFSRMGHRKIEPRVRRCLDDSPFLLAGFCIQLMRVIKAHGLMLDVSQISRYELYMLLRGLIVISQSSWHSHLPLLMEASSAVLSRCCHINAKRAMLAMAQLLCTRMGPDTGLVFAVVGHFLQRCETSLQVCFTLLDDQSYTAGCGILLPGPRCDRHPHWAARSAFASTGLDEHRLRIRPRNLVNGTECPNKRLQATAGDGP